MRLVFITLAWVGGLWFATTFVWLNLVFWLCALLAVMLVSGVPWRQTKPWLAVLPLVFVLGGMRAQWLPQAGSLAQFNDRGGLQITGVVTEVPEQRDDRLQVIIDASEVFDGRITSQVDGRIVADFDASSGSITLGDEIVLAGTMRTPRVFDSFSYRDYLALQGVFGVVRPATLNRVTARDGGWRETLLGWRNSIGHNIDRALPDPQAALLRGILLGDETGISPQLADDFSRAGAAHIIAISGFNMVLIGGLCVSLFSQFTRRRWVIVFSSIALLGMYTLFVGATPAVLRAALMSALLIVAPLLNRRTFTPASLAFVVLAMSALQPSVLWDLGFQLSFFAVLGIMLFATPLQRVFDAMLRRLLPGPVRSLVGGFLEESLVITLAVSVFTVPLAAVYFQSVSLVMLLVNLLIVPVQALILIVGGLAALLSIVTFPVAQVVFWLVQPLLAWSIAVVRLFASIPVALLAYAPDPRVVTIAFIIILGGAMTAAIRPPWLRPLWNFLTRRMVLLTGVAMALGFLILSGAMLLSRPDGRLHVWMLQTGHSNAWLVQTPSGAQVLIDGGRYPTQLLTALGDNMPFHDRHIELLVMTHPDAFDTGALPAVLQRYTVGVFVSNGMPGLDETIVEVERLLGSTPRVDALAGSRIDLGDGVSIDVLYPYTTPTIEQNLSDGALVLKLSYGDVSFLLTSDISAEGQRSLIDGTSDPIASVMQLPQHGTSRSLDAGFLERVQPQVVLLQAEQGNPRGDPDDGILNSIDDLPLFRTDTMGTVHLWTDGATLWAQPQKRTD